MGRLQTFEGLYQPKRLRGGQVGRAIGGAGWLHPTLIDDNWDQILSVSKQAQKVATRLVRTEGGSPNRAAIQSQQWEDAIGWASVTRREGRHGTDLAPAKAPAAAQH